MAEIAALHRTTPTPAEAKGWTQDAEMQAQRAAEHLGEAIRHATAARAGMGVIANLERAQQSVERAIQKSAAYRRRLDRKAARGATPTHLNGGW